MRRVLGLAPSYRAAVESGAVVAAEHACYTVISGLRAAIQGVPFMPVAGMFGSDLLVARDFRTVADPYTGEEVVAIRAIRPDVAIIHVQEADEFGNARIVGTLFEDVLMAQAAEVVIMTAERIVDGARVRGRSARWPRSPRSTWMRSSRRRAGPGRSVAPANTSRISRT